jgi:hypothetical protein
MQQAIQGTVENLEGPFTIKQIFYALADQGIVPQTYKGYRQTISVIKRMQASGILTQLVI